MDEIDWSIYPNFSKSEFDCRETSENKMVKSFMDRLQSLRNEYGKPMVISSGYRSPMHSIEARKVSPGSHASGRACDVVVSGSDAYQLVGLAINHGFTGVGVSQKGDVRFIHLDDLEGIWSRPRPHIWSY